MNVHGTFALNLEPAPEHRPSLFSRLADMLRRRRMLMLVVVLPTLLLIF